MRKRKKTNKKYAYRYLVGNSSEFPESEDYDTFKAVLFASGCVYVCQHYDVDAPQTVHILYADFRTSDWMKSWFNGFTDSIISRDIGNHKLVALREVWKVKTP